MSAINSIRKFIASSEYRNLVELGYEIETQFESADSQFDTDSFCDNWECTDDEIVAYLGLSWNSEWVRAIRNYNSEGLLGAFELDRDTLFDRALELEQENEDSPYWEHNSKDSVDIDGFYCKADGSVSGWEFSTLTEDKNEGGINYERAILLANRLYDELPSDYSCDDECSAHVHIKVQGVERHIGSYKLYMLIIDELSKIWAIDDKLPLSVKRRIQRCTHYYAPRSDHTNKYNTVRVHPQGTWEFRLWGNCQDSDDVQACIDATIEAFRNAYSRYFSRDNSLVEKMNELFSHYDNPLSGFRDIATTAMRELSTISEVIAKLSVRA
jgi:hypothetical protein